MAGKQFLVFSFGFQVPGFARRSFSVGGLPRCLCFTIHHLKPVSCTSLIIEDLIINEDF